MVGLPKAGGRKLPTLCAFLLVLESLILSVYTVNNEQQSKSDQQSQSRLGCHASVSAVLNHADDRLDALLPMLTHLSAACGYGSHCCFGRWFSTSHALYKCALCKQDPAKACMGCTFYAVCQA